MAEPMTLREAVEALRLGPDECKLRGWNSIEGKTPERYARARAIVDAAVEAHENLPSLKLAAYRAGVEAAAKVCDDESDCEQDSIDGSYHPNEAMILRDKILALPAPTPEELEQIR